MTADQNVRMMIGNLIIENIALSSKIQEQTEENAKLKAELEAKKPAQE